MATEEKVKETQVSQQGDTRVVREKTAQASSADTQFTVANAIWWLVGALEILFAFRFFFKLFGANPLNGFVNFIYDLSGWFLGPFENIFGTPETTRGAVTVGVFETSTIVAMVVYLLLGWGLVKLLNINRRDA